MQLLLKIIKDNIQDSYYVKSTHTKHAYQGESILYEENIIGCSFWLQEIKANQ